MSAFHTATLYERQPPADRIAWILASATIPTPLHKKDDPPMYRREHTRLWNLECHRRAVKIRVVLDDLAKDWT